MKDTARSRTRRQESPAIGQHGLAAMLDARATLYSTIMRTGMNVVSAMLEDDRVRLCGPRYEHDAQRRAHRAGHVDGELVLGGRRVRVRRPRVRGDAGEIVLPTWEQFACEDPLGERAVERMVLGVSTRNYGIRFPLGLRAHFLRTNGGSPDPYVHEDGSVISECLILTGRGSAADAYRDLAVEKRVVPAQLFPFAVEGGGDLFLVDCSSPEGMVYLWRHDLSANTLVPLNARIDDFCSRVGDDIREIHERRSAQMDGSRPGACREHDRANLNTPTGDSPNQGERPS